MDAQFPSNSTSDGDYAAEAAARFVSVMNGFHRAAEATVAEFKRSLAMGDIDASRAISDRLARDIDIIGASLQALCSATGVGVSEVYRAPGLPRRLDQQRLGHELGAPPLIA